MSAYETSLHVGDVAIGDRLAGFEMEVTFKKVIHDAASTWDYFPGHHDPDYAREQGQPTIYLNTMFLEGVIDRTVTEWAGPRSMIRRRRMRMARSIFAGDTLRAVGEVVGIHPHGDLVEVRVEVSNGREIATTGDVTVQLDVSAPF